MLGTDHAERYSMEPYYSLILDAYIHHQFDRLERAFDRLSDALKEQHDLNIALMSEGVKECPNTHEACL